MPGGPAVLALRTGAPLYVASIWYERHATCARLDGPLEVPGPDSGPFEQRVRAVTQQIADRLAAGIARHPEDWHMLQRVWLDDAAPRPVTRSSAGAVDAAAPPAQPSTGST
jgi:KDO2-lipid IV(A) lauroyltransferase